MGRSIRGKRKRNVHLFTSIFISLIFLSLSSANGQTTGSISGAVYEIGTLNPIVGIMVYATPVSFTEDLSAPALTDEYGEYAITGLTEGDYYVRANPYGQNYIGEYYDDATLYSDAVTVTVNAGEDTPGIDFILAPGGMISGTVTDSNGTGIADIVIYAYMDTFPPYLINSAYTDSSGAYTIMGLPAGSVYLTARSSSLDEISYVSEWYDNADSYDNASLVPVNVGLTTDNINIQLEMAGSISGTVYKSDGATPIADIRVNIYTDPCDEFPIAAVFTDDSGEYSINGLPPGNVYVKALSADVPLLGISQTNYLRGWYNNVMSCEEAASVAITAGADTGDINFLLHDDTDADIDEMPDQWEINYFGDISRDGDGDYDSDGTSDLQEYYNGTAPKDISTDSETDTNAGADTDISDYETGDSGSGEGDGGGGGCFISNAVYGLAH